MRRVVQQKRRSEHVSIVDQPLETIRVEFVECCIRFRTQMSARLPLSVDKVDPVAAIQVITARSTFKPVAAVASSQNIVPGASVEDIVAGVTAFGSAPAAHAAAQRRRRGGMRQRWRGDGLLFVQRTVTESQLLALQQQQEDGEQQQELNTDLDDFKNDAHSGAATIQVRVVICFCIYFVI